MFSSLQAPLAFGLIAAFVTTIGLIAVSTRGDWSRRYANLFGLAAAGMLLTLTLTHIAPAALAQTARAPSFLLAGFLGGLILSFLIRAILQENPESTRPAEAFTPLAAIACHSFIDGIVYTITFAADFESGVYTAVSLILHEFPEGVIAFAILRAHNVNNRQAFLYAFCAAALTTPLGVLAAGPAVTLFGSATVTALFALSAGLLLYVATGPLMAPLRNVRPSHGLLSLFSGVTVALLLAALPFHNDDHDHGLADEGPDFSREHAHDH